ncbi:MAG: helix-turn-helix domain-containing protein [Bacilli bacterium]
MNKDKMGKFLTELRKEKNLTLQEAGEIFLVSFQAISKWEKGESIPDIAILEKLSKFYNVSIEEIINGERKAKEVRIEVNNIPYKKPRVVKVNDILIGSLYLVFIFLIGLFCQVQFEYSTNPLIYNSQILVSANMYDLIFTANYKAGNVFILLSLIFFILSTIFCILCGTAMSNIKSGNILRRVFAFASTICAMIYITIATDIYAFGAVIYVLYILSYTLLIYCLPSFQEKETTYIVPRKMKLGYIITSYVCLLIGIIFILSLVDKQTTLQCIFLVLIGIFSINEIRQKANFENRIAYLSLMITSIVLSAIAGYYILDYDYSHIQTIYFTIFAAVYIIFFVIYMAIFHKKQQIE